MARSLYTFALGGAWRDGGKWKASDTCSLGTMVTYCFSSEVAQYVTRVWLWKKLELEAVRARQH
jgi:hypothetical protein